MALNESLFQVPFVAGLNENTDEKILEMPNLLVANDIRFVKKTIRPRPGFNDIADVHATNNTIGATTFGHELIAQTDGTYNLLSLSPTLNVFRAQTNQSLDEPAIGGFDFAIKQRFIPTRNIYDFDSKSAEAPSGTQITCYAWTEETSNRVGIKLVDEANESVIYSESTVVATQPSNIRVIVCGGNFIVLWARGTLIEGKFAPVNFTGSFTFVSPVIAVISAGSNFEAIDATDSAGTPFIAISSTSGVLAIDLNTVSISLVVLNTVTHVPTGAINQTSLGMTYRAAAAGANIYHTSFFITGTGVWTLITTDVNLLLTGTLALTPASTYVTRTAMYIDGTTGYFLHTTSNAVGRPIGITIFTSAAAPAVSVAQTVILRGAIILTGMVKSASSGIVFVAGYRGLSTLIETIQPTAFVVSVTTLEPNQVRGRFMFGEADDFFVTGGQYVPRVATLEVIPNTGSARYRCLLPKQVSIVADVVGDVVTDVSQRLATELTLSESNLLAKQTTEYTDDLFFSGAKPGSYNGITGFNLFPEQLSAASTGIGALFAAATVLQYIAYYQHVDDRGRVHRSGTSPAITITIGAGGSAGINVTVPTLRIGPPNNTTIVLCRTTGTTGLGDFRVVSSPVSPTLNNPLVDSVVINDVISDAILLAKESLYTAGGVLDNSPILAHKYSVVHQRRLFVAGLEDPFSIAYSKEDVPGDGVSFSDVLSLSVPPTAGPITGLLSMDDKLIIACERDFWMISGSGPTPSGASNGYAEPQLLGIGYGISKIYNAWRSMLIFNEGFAFMTSFQGFRLVTRGLILHPTWGLETNFGTSRTVVGAFNDVDTNELRWCIRTGANCTVYVYSTEVNQWLKHTAIESQVGYVQWRGDVTVANTVTVAFAGNLQQSDKGPNATYEIETSWIKLSGIQGLQRIWHWHLLGTFVSNCTLTVTAYTEFNGAVSTETFSLALTSTNCPNGVMELRHHMAKQKCTGIKFKIRVSPGGAYLTGLALRAGVRHGSPRLEAAKTL